MSSAATHSNINSVVTQSTMDLSQISISTPLSKMGDSKAESQRSNRIRRKLAQLYQPLETRKKVKLKGVQVRNFSFYIRFNKLSEVEISE